MGERESVCELPPGARLADVCRHYEKSHPGLIAWRSHIQMAINREIESETAGLAEGDEVAFLPPASGG